MGIVLYPHNKETYAKVVSLFQTNDRVGIVQPTGTGKSFIFLKWIEDDLSKSILILSPSQEIFRQLKEYACTSGQQNLLKDVKMITYQLLISMSDQEIANIRADKIIVDEFHRTGADKWELALKKIMAINPQAKVLGASATPVRYLDNVRDMASELFDRNLAVEMTLGEAVKRGILPKPKYVPIWYDIDGKLARYEQDIAKISNGKKRQELEVMLRCMKHSLESSHGAKEIIASNLPHDHVKMIVFCKNKDHLVKMKSVVPDWFYGINNCVHVYESISKQEDKDIQLNEFKKDNDTNAVKLLFVIDRLNEGIHVKGIDGIIMLRPTVSPIVYLQQLGRALATNNSSPIIFDMVNNYLNVQVPTGSGMRENAFVAELKEASQSNVQIDCFDIFQEAVEFASIFKQLEDRLYLTVDEKWIDRYNLYLQYRKEFGCDPQKDTVYCGVPIGNWCSTQKINYNNGTLLPDRAQMLLDAGFDFQRRYTWKESYDLYVAYKKEFGKEPAYSEVYRGYEIGKWRSAQRYKYLNNLLSEEQKNLLIEAAFSCRTNSELEFEEYLALYAEFKSKFGQEPEQDTIYQGVDLGSWCQNQKKKYAANGICKARLDQLEKVGFSFDRYTFEEQQWKNKYDILIAYIREFGVEPNYNCVYKGVRIGNWLKRQRNALNNGELLNWKKELLLSSGVNLNKRKKGTKNPDQAWMRKFELCVLYKQTYGEDPKSNSIIDGENIGNWYVEQQRRFEKGQLPEKRQSLFVKFGLSLERKAENSKECRNEAIWDEYLLLLSEFMREFGRQPKKEELYCGKTLGNWCSAQKSQYVAGKLSTKREDRLRAIGFSFDDINEVSWTRKYDLYVAYKKEFSDEPKTSTTYHEVRLGIWCIQQRQAFYTNAIPDKRLTALRKAGFPFEKFRAQREKRFEQWLDKLQIYKEYKEKFGGEPKKRDVYCDIAIGTWCVEQRQNCKRGKLSAEKIKMLTEAGFQF